MQTASLFIPEDQSSIQNVIAFLRNMFQQMMSLGSVDSEKSAFEKIESDLLNGSITPDEARHRAYSIETTRYDYR